MERRGLCTVEKGVGSQREEMVWASPWGEAMYSGERGGVTERGDGVAWGEAMYSGERGGVTERGDGVGFTLG